GTRSVITRKPLGKTAFFGKPIPPPHSLQAIIQVHNSGWQTNGLHGPHGAPGSSRQPLPKQRDRARPRAWDLSVRGGSSRLAGGPSRQAGGPSRQAGGSMRRTGVQAATRG